MAQSADRDEKDEKDEKGDAEHEESSHHESSEEEPRPAAKASAKGEEAAAKPSAKEKDEDASADEDEEEAARGEGDDDDEEEEEAPAAKPAAKRAGRGPGASRARSAPAQGGGSLGKSVLLFFVIVIGLGVGFAILGKEQPPQAARPKWKTGEVVDVDITLVSTDAKDLACASTEQIAGKHCAFEAANKVWSKGGGTDDKSTLKPYTTTDQVNLAAAGLWSEPALAPGKLPAARFSVKCKYKIEGTLKTLGVRWREGDQFYPNGEWYAGSVSDCKLASN